MTLIGLTAAPATAQTGGVSLAGAGTQAKLRYGERARAERPRARPARVVRLEYAPRGGAWRNVGQTTAPHRRPYSFRLRPTRSGAFRAVSPEGISSTRARDGRGSPRRPRQPARALG